MCVRVSKTTVQVLRLYCEEDQVHLDQTGHFLLTEPITYEYKCPVCGTIKWDQAKYPVTVALTSGIDNY